MFRNTVRAARPVILNILKPKAKNPLCNFHTTLRVTSGGPAAPQIYGPGGKPGEVPSDLEQATGLERLQVLGELAGIDVFDSSPLDSSRIGTKAEPIQVPSYAPERIVGCTGSPADSHDTLWFWVREDKQSRCTECGSVYALKPLDGTVEELTLA